MHTWICIRIKVNGYYFRGSYSVIFIFAYLLNGSQFLKFVIVVVVLLFYVHGKEC